MNGGARFRAWAVTLVLSGLFGVATRAAGGPEALAAMADAERAFARASAGARHARRLPRVSSMTTRLVSSRRSDARRRQWASRPEPANPLATTLAWDPRTGEVSVERPTRVAGRARTCSCPRATPRRRIYGCYFSIWTPRRAGTPGACTSTSACRRRILVSSRPPSRPSTRRPGGAAAAAGLRRAAARTADRLLDTRVARRRVGGRVRPPPLLVRASPGREAATAGSATMRRTCARPGSWTFVPAAATSPRLATSGTRTGHDSEGEHPERTGGLLRAGWRRGGRLARHLDTLVARG